MRVRFIYVYKFVQTAITAFALWRILSESLICGSFVSVKEPLHHGIRGACKALFIYVDPKRQPSMGGDDNRRPSVRAHLNVLIGQGQGHAPQISAPQMSANRQIRPRLRLWWFFEASNFLPPPPTEQEVGQLVDQVKQEELLLLTKSNSRRRRRRRSASWDDNSRQQWDHGGGGDEETAHNNNKKNLAAAFSLDDDTNGSGATTAPLFCYELNLQGTSSPNETLLSLTKVGSPLIILANRSVVTVAVALAHFLLLFAQIYLLNCLDEDNFEQKRGKLFLELFVLILSCLSWMIVCLLSLRTEFDWEHMWLCTNFRPKLLTMVIIIQTVAAVLLLMSLSEGIRVFLRMKKYDQLIERMKQRKINKYRPRG